MRIADYSNSTKLEAPIEELYHLIYKIYLDKGFVVRFSNLSPVSAQIKIETKWSWRSYGEDIIIDLENTDGRITTIKFLSSCSGIFQIFDWGKNKKKWIFFKYSLKTHLKNKL